jgi:hypothetical protein
MWWGGREGKDRSTVASLDAKLELTAWQFADQAKHQACVCVEGVKMKPAIAALRCCCCCALSAAAGSKIWKTRAHGPTQKAYPCMCTNVRTSRCARPRPARTKHMHARMHTHLSPGRPSQAILIATNRAPVTPDTAAEMAKAGGWGEGHTCARLPWSPALGGSALVRSGCDPSQPSQRTTAAPLHAGPTLNPRRLSCPLPAVVPRSRVEPRH